MKTFVKFVSASVLVIFVSACSTAGGLVTGMGEDLQKAGGWIKSK